ncbi:hypothetical protein BH23ACT3_BH23ACT3_17580 [soil metagenome]
MATILAHIRVTEGSEERFEEVIRGLYDATHRTETGVRRYEYWRGSEPRSYYTLLSFDDFRGFIAHQVSDHHEAAAAQFRAMFESFRIEWCDPVDGASDLPPTESQDMAADADELTLNSAERFAVRSADWWSRLRR